jgi:replication initiator protein RepSA
MLSTLDPTPHPTRWGVGSNAEPTRLTTTIPAPAPVVDRSTATGQALWRAATEPDYHRWLTHVSAAAGCTRPIRLTGVIDTVDPTTGQRLNRLATDGLPDGHLYKACGNRRATVCPSCAETYRADAYQLIRAGLVGGKGVPDTVAKHPAVFVTLTAPSFGLVHTRVVRKHTCTHRRRCDCRPEPCRARRPGSVAPACPHGQPTVCWARHEDDDPRLGQPLCLDCYDHQGQVVWNLFAGALWHRTKQAAERYLTQLARQRGIPPVYQLAASGKLRAVPPVRISHGKVAEMQRRAVVHFHTLLRLDGVDPDDPTAVIPPPAGLTAQDLDDAVSYAAAHTTHTTPTHPDRPAGWVIGWGDEGAGRYADVRHLALAGQGDISPEMVAGYLAKYATKSTEATGHTSTRLTPETVGEHADPDGDHTARLIDACWHLGRPTTTPVPLSERPDRDRPTPGLRSAWRCPQCGANTRLALCPTCQPSHPDPDASAANTPGGANPYHRLRRWAHMLGFGGHFLTKARRYSTTFTHLRGIRVEHRRAHDDGRHDQDHAHPGASARDQHTDGQGPLIVATLTFAGAGWHTTGDALLANTAADLARSRRHTGLEEIAHEHSTTRPAPLPIAA